MEEQSIRTSYVVVPVVALLTFGVTVGYGANTGAALILAGIVAAVAGGIAAMAGPVGPQCRPARRIALAGASAAGIGVVVQIAGTFESDGDYVTAFPALVTIVVALFLHVASLRADVRTVHGAGRRLPVLGTVTVAAGEAVTLWLGWLMVTAPAKWGISQADDDLDREAIAWLIERTFAVFLLVLVVGVTGLAFAVTRRVACGRPATAEG